MFRRDAFSVAGAQLALDFCCAPEDFAPGRMTFTQYVPQDGRRMFDDAPWALKICAFGGGAVFTGEPGLISALKARFEHAAPEWLFDSGDFSELENILCLHGAVPYRCHLFFLPGGETPALPLPEKVRVFEQDELEQFRGTVWGEEALAFDALAPDMLAVAACQGEEIIGMAGASADSDAMWQIGVSVLPEHRGRGIASGLTAALARETALRGKIPFYGTAMSHIASQNVALRAGFIPAWAEYTARAKK